MDEEKQIEYLKATDMIIETIKETEKRIHGLSKKIEQEESELVKTYRDRTAKILTLFMLKRWAYVFFISSAIIAAFYGLFGYLASDVSDLMRQKKELQEEIRTNTEEIERQKKITWGIVMREIGSERYIVVPSTMTVDKRMNQTGETILTFRKNIR